MKALSFHQPWAELILQGRKTIDLRTWQTRHRGPIAIHAGQTVNEAACAAHGLDPSGLLRGALLGTVEVVEVIALDREQWEALRSAHLAVKEYPGDIYGWRLANPQRLAAPIPMPGHLGLYSVPDEALAGGAPATACAREQLAFDWTAPVEAHDPGKPFELRVVPREGQDYALALYQWPVAANGSPRPGAQRLGELSGPHLQAVTDHVLEALRGAGYRMTDLSRERRQPFRLPEEAGLRLGLLFLAARPLARMDRVEAISGGVRAMPSEEAYYWFSKCTAHTSAANAQRALRILLAGE